MHGNLDGEAFDFYPDGHRVEEDSPEVKQYRLMQNELLAIQEILLNAGANRHEVDVAARRVFDKVMELDQAIARMKESLPENTTYDSKILRIRDRAGTAYPIEIYDGVNYLRYAKEALVRQNYQPHAFAGPKGSEALEKQVGAIEQQINRTIGIIVALIESYEIPPETESLPAAGLEVNYAALEQLREAIFLELTNYLQDHQLATRIADELMEWAAALFSILESSSELPDAYSIPHTKDSLAFASPDEREGRIVYGGAEFLKEVLEVIREDIRFAGRREARQVICAALIKIIDHYIQEAQYAIFPALDKADVDGKIIQKIDEELQEIERDARKFVNELFGPESAGVV